jgi:integrase
VKLENGTIGKLLALPEGKRDVIFWDDELIGFGLRLRSTGTDTAKVRRSYITQYRSKGRTRRLLIGAADRLSPAQARAAARKVLAKVALGEDPQAKRVEERLRAPLTLRSVAQDYLDTKLKQVRPRSYREISRYLLAGYFRPLHSTSIAAISRADIAARISKIGKESGATTANRARAALSALFAWAMGQGLCETNPTIGTNKLAENPTRDRVLSDSEIIAVWRACEDLGAFGKAIRLLLLTACRREEVGQMRRSELDDAGNFTLDPSRTKNGRKHVLPLPELALEILASTPRGRTYLVFGPHGVSNWERPKRQLDARLGKTVQAWRVHDLRRTAATKMADLGIAPHVVETILNHQSGHKAGIAGIYNRARYAGEVKQALAIWAAHITALLSGERKIINISRAHTAAVS